MFNKKEVAVWLNKDKKLILVHKSKLAETIAGEQETTLEKVEETIDKGKMHRARVRQPGDFQDGTFRTIDIDPSGGISSVVGRLKDGDKMTAQNFMFDAEKWTVAEAREWLSKHGHEVIQIDEAEKAKKPKEEEADDEDKKKPREGCKEKCQQAAEEEEQEAAEQNGQMEIVKVDDAQRLVYGVFLWPERADHDGDVISASDIEKVAHGFMADYRDIDEMHAQETTEADIVESAIAWEDGLNYHGKKLSKGAWFGAVKVHNDKVWGKIKDGTYKGFSVRISGTREPIDSIEDILPKGGAGSGNFGHAGRPGERGGSSSEGGSGGKFSDKEIAAERAAVESSAREEAKAAMESSASQFNNFKTTQDQKYYIYDTFGRANPERTGVKVGKEPGSNQVWVEHNGKMVYNSDTDNFTPSEFKNFVSDLYASIRVASSVRLNAISRGGDIDKPLKPGEKPWWNPKPDTKDPFKPIPGDDSGTVVDDDF